MADITITEMTEKHLLVFVSPGKGDTLTVQKFAAKSLGLFEADLEVKMAAGVNMQRVTPRSEKEDAFAEAVKKLRDAAKAQADRTTSSSS